MIGVKSYRLSSAALAVLLGLGALTVAAPKTFGAAASVEVSLPGFAVTLNGNVVDNARREYPLLVYKDITYVPMTWYDSRLLGLEAKWSADQGLSIEQKPVTASYHTYEVGTKNKNRYRAERPTSKVTVAGETVDNGAEEYPLLSFRDVTYFPLTWRFAHEIFGWDYTWDPRAGLSIRSNNLQVQDTGLEPGIADNGFGELDEFHYFAKSDEAGQMNHIYRAPVADPLNRTELYAYSLSDGQERSPYVHFQVREGEMWFSIHRGGAIMGSDLYVRVAKDGAVTEERSGYLDFAWSKAGTVLLSYGVPPREGNLALDDGSSLETRQWKPLGRKDLMYGWTIHQDGESTGYGRGTWSVVGGTDIYVQGSYGLGGSSAPLQPPTLNRIYRVNAVTGDTRLIVDTAVSLFRVVDERLLYYVKQSDGMLYRSALDGTGETLVTDRPIAYGVFEVAPDGTVYYSSKSGSGVSALYRADAAGEDPIIIPYPVPSLALAKGTLVAYIGGTGGYGAAAVSLKEGSVTYIADDVTAILANPEEHGYTLITDDKRVLRVE